MTPESIIAALKAIEPYVDADVPGARPLAEKLIKALEKFYS